VHIEVKEREKKKPHGRTKRKELEKHGISRKRQRAVSTKQLICWFLLCRH
jgi:hypothetical protein